MTSCVITKGSKIELPSRFVEIERTTVGREMFPGYMYFDASLLNLYFQSAKLHVGFRGYQQLFVVTYAEPNRLGIPAKSEEIYDWGSRTSHRAATPESLFYWVIEKLSRPDGLQTGYVAFIYEPRISKDAPAESINRCFVTPIGFPGAGHYWKLVGVVE